MNVVRNKVFYIKVYFKYFKTKMYERDAWRA